ncbi:hypothetical protein HDU86_000320 [Geranomyces michiganensis]|nr:hypothetical protein HDU86_000320 [Geranomyces michiganensis]
MKALADSFPTLHQWLDADATRPWSTFAHAIRVDIERVKRGSERTTLQRARKAAILARLNKLMTRRFEYERSQQEYSARSDKQVDSIIETRRVGTLVERDIVGLVKDTLGKRKRPNDEVNAAKPGGASDHTIIDKYLVPDEVSSGGGDEQSEQESADLGSEEETADMKLASADGSSSDTEESADLSSEEETADMKLATADGNSSDTEESADLSSEEETADMKLASANGSSSDTEEWADLGSEEETADMKLASADGSSSDTEEECVQVTAKPASCPPAFFFAESDPESIASSETSMDSDTELPVAVDRARLIQAQTHLKNKKWDVGGCDVAQKLRSMQKAVLRDLNDSNFMSDIAGALLCDNTMLITVNKPNSKYYARISDGEWTSIRDALTTLLLKIDPAVEVKARAECIRMREAKLASRGYRVQLLDEESPEECALALMLEHLHSVLDVCKPEKKVREPTWCMKFVGPYFHLAHARGLSWTYDNTTPSVSKKRPDFHVMDKRKVGLAAFEVKPPGTGTKATVHDMAKVIAHGVRELKEELARLKPKGNPGKLCISIVNDIGTIFFLTVHEGMFMAIEIGTWTLPTALLPNQEAHFAAGVAMGVAVFRKIDWIHNLTKKYEEIGNGANRSNLLPAPTPRKSKPGPSATRRKRTV